MESTKLKLLVPACCPNCGYDLQPENPILPVKLMNAEGKPEALIIEGLFNYIKQVEPSKALEGPQSQTPPRGRRSPPKYQVKQEAGRRSRKRGGRGRDRKPESKLEAGPTMNPIQKRLLEIASEKVKVPPPEPVPAKRKAEASQPPVSAKDTVKDEPVPAIPHIESSVLCSKYSQNDVDMFLTEFLAQIEDLETAGPEESNAQIPIEAPRPTKIPWKGYRVSKQENLVLKTGDPPIYDSLSGAALPTGFLDLGPSAAPVPAPTDSGRVVAIHNHFYGESAVIPDSP